jgi:hypothetical protein
MQRDVMECCKVLQNPAKKGGKKEILERRREGRIDSFPLPYPALSPSSSQTSHLRDTLHFVVIIILHNTAAESCLPTNGRRYHTY